MSLCLSFCVETMYLEDADGYVATRGVSGGGGHVGQEARRIEWALHSSNLKRKLRCPISVGILRHGRFCFLLRWPQNAYTPRVQCGVLFTHLRHINRRHRPPLPLRPRVGCRWGNRGNRGSGLPVICDPCDPCDVHEGVVHQGAAVAAQLEAPPYATRRVLHTRPDRGRFTGISG